MLSKADRKIYDHIRWLKENNKIDDPWSVYWFSLLMQSWRPGFLFHVCLLPKNYWKKVKNDEQRNEQRLRNRASRHNKRTPTTTSTTRVYTYAYRTAVRSPEITNPVIADRSTKLFNYRLSGYAA